MDTSTHEPDWLCKHCGESWPSTFDTCWNCGSDTDGGPDVTFESKREPKWTWGDESQMYEPLWSPPQWTLGDMFWWMTASALYLAALIHLPPVLVIIGMLLWIILLPYRHKIGRRLRELPGALRRGQRSR